MTTEAEDARRRTASLFWRYWSASAISSVGSAVTAVALPLTAVLVLNASALQVSIVAAASYVAWLVLGLPAGVISQRVPLRAMQVAMDLTRAVAIGSVPVAWWLGHLTVVQLVLAALVISFANVLFDVSNSTFIPTIVDRADLTARNSLLSGTDAATQLGGPSLGGVLVQVLGAAPTLVVDAISYVVSACLLRTLPARAVDRPESWPRFGAMIREGWQFVTRHPIMRPCMAVAAIINFVVGGLLALVPVYLVRQMHLPPAVVGLLIATEGVGSLVGAALTPRISRRQGSARAVLLGSVLLAVAALVMPNGHGWVGGILFGLGNAGLAAGAAMISICTRTYRQVASPPELLSRVMATVRFVSWGVVPIGSLVAGAVASSIGAHGALWIFCALTCFAPLVLFGTPVRRLRELTDHAMP
jgi:MFS family permease